MFAPPHRMKNKPCKAFWMKTESGQKKGKSNQMEKIFLWHINFFPLYYDRRSSFREKLKKLKRYSTSMNLFGNKKLARTWLTSDFHFFMLSLNSGIGWTDSRSKPACITILKIWKMKIKRKTFSFQEGEGKEAKARAMHEFCWKECETFPNSFRHHSLLLMFRIRPKIRSSLQSLPPAPLRPLNQM